MSGSMRGRYWLVVVALVGLVSGCRPTTAPGTDVLRIGAYSVVREAFHAEHRRAYGYATPEEPVELMNVGLRATGKTPKPTPKRLEPHHGRNTSARRTQRPVFFPGAGFVDCSVYDRYRLGAGARVPGPAIVDELDSTTVIYPSYAATVDEDGNLVIEREEG